MRKLFGLKPRVIKRKVFVVTPSLPITESGTDKMLYEFINAQIELGNKYLILDMSNSKFIGSSIGELIRILTNISTMNGSLKICCLDKASLQKIKIMRLEKVFDTHDTLEECLNGFS